MTSSWSRWDKHDKYKDTKDSYFYKFDDDEKDSYDRIEKIDRGIQFRQRNGSASSFIFGNQLGYSDYSYKSYFSSFDEKSKYKKILETVASTASILSRLKLKIKWSNGTNTNTNKDTTDNNDIIYLSPNIIDDNFTKKKEWSEEERIDVLVGSVMLYAKGKDIIDVDCNQFIEDLKPGFKKVLTVEFSNVLEYYSVVSNILDEYPGFNNYLVSHRDYYASKNVVKTLEQIINKNKDILDQPVQPPEFVPPILEISRAIQYELVNNSNLDINVTKVRKVMEDIKDILKRNIDVPERRIAAAYKCAKILLTNFPVPKDLEQRIPKIDNLPNLGITQNNSEEVKNDINKDLGEIELENAEQDSQKIFNHVPNNMNTCPTGNTDIFPTSTSKNKKEYLSLLRKNEGLIRKLRGAIKSRTVDPIIFISDMQYGELDEDALYKVCMNKKLPVGFKDLGLFEQQAIISKPKKSITLLVDESGSMGANNRYQIVRDMAVILYNTLLGIPGIQVNILGHTADGVYNSPNKNNVKHCSGLMLTHYHSPMNNNPASIANITHNSGNLDGYALARTAQYINNWKNNDYEFESHLWLVSDGKPCSVGYGGLEAAEHMKRVVKASLLKNIRIFGIGIDNAFTTKEGNAMYGTGNYIVLPDVISSMNVLGKKLTNVLNSGIRINID